MKLSKKRKLKFLFPVPKSLFDYVKSWRMTRKQAVTLRNAIKENKNILITGDTGSGKTVLLNAILLEMSLIWSKRRFAIIEEGSELKSDYFALKACLKSSALKQSDLPEIINSAIRMRPDKIVCGQVSGGGCSGLLKAWAFHCPGGVTTMQGEGVNEALSTLTQNIHDAGTHNPQELIASAINYVVCTKRVGRKRFVSELVEVAGFDQENGEFTTGLIR